MKKRIKDKEKREKKTPYPVSPIYPYSPLPPPDFLSGSTDFSVKSIHIKSKSHHAPPLPLAFRSHILSFSENRYTITHPHIQLLSLLIHRIYVTCMLRAHPHPTHLGRYLQHDIAGITVVVDGFME